MSKALKLLDKNNACDIILKNIHGDLENITYRNTSLLLHGIEEILIKPLYESDSYIINFRFLITKLNKPIKLVEKDNIKLYIYPAITGLSIQQIVANFDSLTEYEFNNIYIVVYIDDMPKYYLYDPKIYAYDWIKFGVCFKNNDIILFLSNFISRNIYSYDTHENTQINISYELNKTSIYTLLHLHEGLVDDIALSEYSDDLITLSESDYLDYVYTDYYTIRACDSHCLSATNITHIEYNRKYDI